MEENLTYEEAIKEIEDIVNKLENGEISLEESIKLFERGKELITYCKNILDNVKGKIYTVKETNNGIEKEEFKR
jgi:exodeoxyribonuclease VII small subunit